MGDMAEVFKIRNEESKKKRASNRQQGPKFLEKADILFISKNDGAHLIVEGNDCFIDFWPGTGTWIVRTGKRGFGVRNLVKYIKEQTP